MSSALLLRLAGAAARSAARVPLSRGVSAVPASNRRLFSGTATCGQCRSCAGVEVRNTAFRSFCTAPSPVVSYEELKELLGSQSTVLIDVREPWEIKEYGKIPGSINIPVGEVGAALQMKPEEFKEKYCRNIPAKSEGVVFSCLAGVRSLKALDVAVSLGYSRAQHYLGGFDDFVRHEPPVKQ
ncbi:hypothetical protein NDU88_004218 [Pleurodeles waltl]|uniref:Rhodanese domain-containing protein n=1 Tax=Pleurodeles waltl TaxID=8319 RepID=A0AAV7RFH4_PLEWA|nr:hypothetical protein NDU88_004218 [Pleurodeles waltl]